MPVQWTNVEVTLGGLDQKTAAPLSAPGKVVALENGRFSRRGAIDKSAGHSALPTAIQGGGSLSAVAQLSQHDGELLAIDGSTLYGFSEAAGAWVSRGRVSEALVERDPVMRSGTNGMGWPDSVIFNGKMLVCFFDEASRLTALVLDASTLRPLQPAHIVDPTGAGDRCRVVLLNGTVVVFYGQAGALWSAQMDTPTLAWSAPEFLGSTTFGDDAQWFEACSCSDYYGVVVWLEDATTVKGANFEHGHSAVTTKTLLNPADSLCVTVASSGNSFAMVVVGQSTPNPVTACVVDVSPFTLTVAGYGDLVAAPTTNTGRVTSHAVAGGYIVGWTSGPNFAFFSAVGIYDTQFALFDESFVMQSGGYRVPALLPVSRPFVLNERVYCLMGEFWDAPSSSVGIFACHLCIDIDGVVRTVPGATLPATRVVAVLASGDAASPLLCMAGAPPVRADGAVVMALPVQAAVGVSIANDKIGADAFTLNFAGDASSIVARARWPLAEGLEACPVGGGLLQNYDGESVTEWGFLHEPAWIKADAVAPSGGTMSAGTYFYKAIYTWVDARGMRQRSVATPEVEFVADGAHNAKINVACLSVSAKRAKERPILVAIYRRDPSGVVYHNVGATRAAMRNVFGSASVTWTDKKAADFYNANETLYSETELIEIAPAASDAIATHRGRVWAARGNVVWYTKSFVPGWLPAFNDSDLQLTIATEETITALASMDDKLVVFTKNTVWVIYGEGPSDAGTQNDYAVQRVASDVGCVDQRSVVLVLEGLMFQSVQGVSLLTRGLQVQYVGPDIEGELAARGHIIAANFIADRGEVHLLAVDDAATESRVLLLDQLSGQWSTLSPTADAWIAQGLHAGTVARASLAGAIGEASESSRLDLGEYQATKVETGWLRLAGLQGYARMRKVMLLLEKKSRHKLTVDLLYDYDDATVVQTATWDGDAVGALGQREQLEIRVARHKAEAIKVRIYDEADGALGTGEGFVVHGLLLEVGVKRGVFRQETATRR